MAAYSGVGGKCVIGSSGVLNEVLSWQLQEKGDQVETTPMSNGVTTSDRTFVSTLNEWSGQITMNYDPADTDGQELLVANLNVAIKVYPQGDGTLKKYWSGSIIVGDITSQANVDGKIQKSFSFKGNGALTRTSVP